MRGHRDLEAAVVAAAVCAVAALLLPVDFVRLLFALPLALFLPGYGIASATFARRPVERPQLLIVSLGLSLTTLVLGGLLLNYLPGGLRAGTWALLLALIVLAGCRTTALRRQRPPAPGRRRPRWQRPAAVTVGLLLAGALAAAAAVALAFVPVSAKHAVGYTELWIHPFDSGTAAGVQVGVGSEEKRDTTYVLRTRFGAGGAPVVHRFVLDPGETRLLRLATAPPTSPTALPVTATLFRAAQPETPYRRVSAWVVPPGRVRR